MAKKSEADTKAAVTQAFDNESTKLIEESSLILTWVRTWYYSNNNNNMKLSSEYEMNGNLSVPVKMMKK